MPRDSATAPRSPTDHHRSPVVEGSAAPVDPVDTMHVEGPDLPLPRITISTSTVDEEEAAEELAAWLWLNRAERPYVIASSHGQRLLRATTGVVGTAVPGMHASQAWARSRSWPAGEADAVVAVGGGRCLDVGKLVAVAVGVPFIAVPTQLSHDGVCSPVSVLPRTAGGPAESVEAVAPHVAFFSRPTLIRSPIASLRAGIGDLIANPLALRDWQLAADAGLERIDRAAWHLSAESFWLIEPLLEEPFDPACIEPGLVGLLAHALATSGAAMRVVGTSRPASGAEHKISHAIDELFGARAHHGAQVAFASMVSAALHGLEIEGFRQWLVNVGLPHHPHQLGLSSDEMVRVLLRAPATRPGRFTILESTGLDRPAAEVLIRSLWTEV